MTDEQNDTPEVLQRKLARANSEWASMNDQLAAAQAELDGLRGQVAEMKRDAEAAAKLHERRRVALEDAISSALHWQQVAAKASTCEPDARVEQAVLDGRIAILTDQRDAARQAAERAHRGWAWTARAWLAFSIVQIVIWALRALS